jgi:hypothetical protein
LKASICRKFIVGPLVLTQRSDTYFLFHIEQIEEKARMSLPIEQYAGLEWIDPGTA